MSTASDIAYIMSHTDTRTMLEQLAEEGAELSKAALKLIRALGLNGSPTPVTEAKATKELKEEVDDIVLTAYMYGLSVTPPQDNPKVARWAQRKREKEGENGN